MAKANKKILVTGGAGYIGSHSVIELINAGYTPIVVDNLSNAHNTVFTGLNNILGFDVTHYNVNCNDHSILSHIFKKEETIVGAIHFASHKSVGESVKLPLQYYKNNIQSLITLIEVMMENEVYNLVFSSSCAVYGDAEKLPVTEESRVVAPKSPYGNTKKICEEILQDHANSGTHFRSIALRYFNPIGAHESGEIGEYPLGAPANILPIITQAAAGVRKGFTVFGADYATPDGTCVRDFIHITDLAKAHVKALELLENKEGQTYFDTFNIGTGKGYSILELINAFERITGLRLNYTIGPRREGDIEKMYAGVDKATRTLGWKAEKTLDEAISDAWRWQMKIVEMAKKNIF
ncbi:MAG TPA: UDP-glucose 4-epimerase GalE [Cytophagaceae bacterium]|jgi:UDP-glucose 4-epimerase